MEASMRQAAASWATVSAMLEEQIQQAGSFDALRQIDVPTTPVEESLALAFLNLHLLGRAQVWTAVVEPARNVGVLRAGRTVLADVDPLPFEEAIAFFRRKTNLSPEAFYALTEAARVKAFTVAVGAEETIIEAIRDLVDSALSEGLTLREFQQQAAAVLDRAGVGAASPWYWRLVYSNNLQQSYEVGRWQQMSDPAVAAARPYIRYISARIPTSRPSHVEKHGLIYPRDHEFWRTWAPKNGHGCRCSTMSVSESLLSRRGWKVSTKTKFKYPEPDEGFAYNAGKVEAI